MFKEFIRRMKIWKKNKEIKKQRPKITYKYKKNGIWHDKVEKTKAYKECIAEVEQLADIEAQKTGHVGKGFCHIYWSCKKNILKEKFNIDWRSPAEMNPYSRFD